MVSKLSLYRLFGKALIFKDYSNMYYQLGKRLGHGMGYYDKFLDLCLKKQQKIPHLIALAFNEQLCEDIPTSENDILLDLVLTEK